MIAERSHNISAVPGTVPHCAAWFGLLALGRWPLRCWCIHRLHYGDGPVRGREGCICYAAYVFLCDLLQTINVIEKLSPVSISCLVDRQLLSQASVVAKPSNEIRFGPCFHHFEFRIAHILRFDAINLFRKARLEFGRSVSASGNGVKPKETGIFHAGKIGESYCGGRNLLVAHK